MDKIIFAPAEMDENPVKTVWRTTCRLVSSLFMHRGIEFGLSDHHLGKGKHVTALPNLVPGAVSHTFAAGPSGEPGALAAPARRRSHSGESGAGIREDPSCTDCTDHNPWPNQRTPCEVDAPKLAEETPRAQPKASALSKEASASKKKLPSKGPGPFNLWQNVSPWL